MHAHRVLCSPDSRIDQYADSDSCCLHFDVIDLIFRSHRQQEDGDQQVTQKQVRVVLWNIRVAPYAFRDHLKAFAYGTTWSLIAEGKLLNKET